MIRNELPHETYLEIAVGTPVNGTPMRSVCSKSRPIRPQIRYWQAYLLRTKSPVQAASYWTRPFRFRRILCFPSGRSPFLCSSGPPPAAGRMEAHILSWSRSTGGWAEPGRRCACLTSVATGQTTRRHTPVEPISNREPIPKRRWRTISERRWSARKTGGTGITWRPTTGSGAWMTRH